MYEKVVIEDDAGALGMEYDVFVEMLQERVERIGNSVLFKLYPPLEMSSTTPALLFEDHNGSTYLRIDCLRDD